MTGRCQPDHGNCKRSTDRKGRENRSYSDFEKAPAEVYYGASGPGRLYQRDEMLKDVQPAGAKLHLDDGGLDLWKIG